MSKGLVQAVDHIYLFRVKGEEGDAWKVAYQSDGETSEEREFESTPTKDGSVKSAGAYEATHNISSLLPKGDKVLSKIKELIRAKNPGRLEVWEIDRSDIEEETTLPGEYSVDVVTSVSRTSSSEENVEIEIETEVEGYITSGDVNVTESLLSILKTITDEQAEFTQPTTEE